MNANKRITGVYNAAKQITFDDCSRIVVMSDCHRGDGSWSDNFLKNQHLFFAALTHYYNQNFTYIELGDGDELWENKKLSEIISAHVNTFWLLSKFYNENRLHFIYGNHDMVKRKQKVVKRYLETYYDEREKKKKLLFKDIEVNEGVVLKHISSNNEIFLLHGHQGDCLNDRHWKLARFLVRYLWKPLETFGVNDPTSTAKNYKKGKKVERRLKNWVKHNNCMMIAGHTHRPVFPEIGELLYFNDGSGVHPRCITAIEITYGYISLVKWYVNTKDDGTMFVDKEVLAGPEKLSDYFNK